MIWGSRINKSRRLLAVDCLLQMTMKEGILHVGLMDWPRAGYGEAEDDPNRGRFDNRTESLIVVESMLL